jgi:uncharacterized protein
MLKVEVEEKSMQLTERSKLRRRPDRGSHEEETIYRILDAAFMAHVGFSINGQPFVIPTLFGRENDTLYIHGSAASRMLHELEAGIKACVTVTIVDGLVLARSAMHHSMNYRSVVAFGCARKIEDPDHKKEALRRISEHLIAGRWAEVREPNEKELKATAVLEFTIEEASAKIRTGGVIDDEEDYSIPVWAGVLPLVQRSEVPIPDARLSPAIQIPEYIHHYSQPNEKI